MADRRTGVRILWLLVCTAATIVTTLALYSAYLYFLYTWLTKGSIAA
jgi:hypothetical protein